MQWGARTRIYPSPHCFATSGSELLFPILIRFLVLTKFVRLFFSHGWIISLRIRVGAAGPKIKIYWKPCYRRPYFQAPVKWGAEEAADRAVLLTWGQGGLGHQQVVSSLPVGFLRSVPVSDTSSSCTGWCPSGDYQIDANCKVRQNLLTRIFCLCFRVFWSRFHTLFQF